MPAIRVILQLTSRAEWAHSAVAGHLVAQDATSAAEQRWSADVVYDRQQQQFVLYKPEPPAIPALAVLAQALEAAWRCGCSVEIRDELGRPLLLGPTWPVEAWLTRWLRAYLLADQDHS